MEIFSGLIAFALFFGGIGLVVHFVFEMFTTIVDYLSAPNTRFMEHMNWFPCWGIGFVIWAGVFVIFVTVVNAM